MSFLKPHPRLFSFLTKPLTTQLEISINHPRLLSSAAVPGGSQSTIYALATGGIRCALAVIRVSGPCSGEMVRKIARYPEGKLPEPRKATLRKLCDPVSNKIIDHGIVIWFPGPKSYTGEDACELHLHGSKAVISSMFEAIQTVKGCRMAEPGEFSKRAFLNGKMDLTAVEGLGDLISAETEMQRAQALHQMSGSLGSLYGSWRDRLAKCLANAEAFIDFGEDENIEADVLENVGMELEQLLEEMESHINDHHRGERLRNGVRIAILGKPNVGKSSLLNILTRRDAAIVSSIPGTTRDVVEACIDFKGYPIVFADTAGIRSSPDEIEKEGIRRAMKEARKADIVVLVLSCENVSNLLGQRCIHNQDTLTKAVAEAKPAAEIHKTELIQHELAELDLLEDDGDDKEGSAKEFFDKVLLVANKVDLAAPPQTNAASLWGDGDAAEARARLGNMVDALISCKTNSGLDTFTELLHEKVSELCSDPEFESPCLTRERYRSHLRNCIESLQLYLNPEDYNQQDLALRTHYLKSALNNLGYITGHVGTDDILDIIFRDFCIGK